MSKLIPASINLYPVDVFFVPDEKSWLKEQKKRGFVEPWPKSAAHCLFFQRNSENLIYVFVNRTDGWSEAEHEALLIHELSHVSDFIFEAAGEEKPGIETKAYLLQRLYLDFRDALNEP